MSEFRFLSSAVADSNERSATGTNFLLDDFGVEAALKFLSFVNTCETDFLTFLADFFLLIITDEEIA